MSKKTIAVLFGGMSSEHDVSKVSARNIINALPPEKYLAIPVYITREGKWLLYDGGSDITNVQWERQGTPAVLSPDATHGGLLRVVGGKVKVVPVDMVFPAMHGRFGEDGTVQGLCELAGIPYVGAGVLASAVCMDKAFTKSVVKGLGVAQTEYIVVKESEIENGMAEIYKKVRYKIGYPCFVKPANAGSSRGISKVMGKDKLADALSSAFLHDGKVLVERAVVGRELECAVLGNDDPEVSGVGEVIPAPGSEFYDYDAKYHDEGSITVVEPDIPENVREAVRSAAAAVYAALGCEGMARADFFWDAAKDKVIFNEINTIPGFTAISLYHVLWKAAGVPLGALVDRLVCLGIERFERGKRAGNASGAGE